MDLVQVSPAQSGDPSIAGDEVIAASARTDRQAFAELYVRHRQAVLGYLRARTASDDDAVELTAVTFERALLGIDQYQPKGAGFRAWLFRIARNAAIDEARRRGRLAPPDGVETIDPAPGPDAAVIRTDDARRLRAAIARLSAGQADALGLRFGAGLTAREIGAVIGKRDAAVQKLIERAVDRLREELE